MVQSELAGRRRDIEEARADAGGSSAPVDPLVLASWRRSEAVVGATVEAAPVGSSDDAARRWDDSAIRRAAPRLADDLEQLAVTGDLIALVTDADGRVMWQATPPWLRRSADRVGLVPGGVWNEGTMGTNGVGLALAADRPASVFAAEHWLGGVQDWVCYAAPVHAPDGTQVGALDLSTRWTHAHPLALATVASLARLVDNELRSCPGVALRPPAPRLELRVLGEPQVVLDGKPVRLTHRQLEILTILAVADGCSLDQLHARLYGDRPVATATLKAEISHLRRSLSGRLASRPYRLTAPCRVDADELPRRLRSGDVDGAARLYRGQLLPASEAPFLVELRQQLDVALRTALLRDGTCASVLRYAQVQPYDAQVLETAASRASTDDPLLPAVAGRLAVARTP